MSSASQHAGHGKPSRIRQATFVAFIALVAQTLRACSALPTSSSEPYANLNEQPPSRDPSADQGAPEIKADLIATRDDAERAAAGIPLDKAVRW